jgi:hypothetical protein
VKVLDGIGGIVGRLVAHVTNTSLRDQLDVGNLSVVGGEVFAKLSLGEVGWQPSHKDS